MIDVGLVEVCPPEKMFPLTAEQRQPLEFVQQDAAAEAVRLDSSRETLGKVCPRFLLWPLPPARLFPKAHFVFWPSGFYTRLF